MAVLGGRSDDPRPVPSLVLLDRVRAYLEARLVPTADLHLVGPDWLRAEVEAEVVAERPEAALEVRDAVVAALEAFLHPLSAGPDGEGWSLGRRPQKSEIHAVIEGTPGVDHVRRLRLELTVTAEAEAAPDCLLIYSGEHRIRLWGGAEEEDPS